MRILLIDDLWPIEKIPGCLVMESSNQVVAARTYNEAQSKLSEGNWDRILLDNDLGEPNEFDGSSSRKEGCDLLNWMMFQLPDQKWPQEVFVFSSNNPARLRMESKLRAMGYEPDPLPLPLWRRKKDGTS